MKISPRQREALAKLADATQATAYDLRIGMNTLEALEGRGLLTARRGLGSMAFPHTSIQWRITPAGRAALGVQ